VDPAPATPPRRPSVVSADGESAPRRPARRWLLVLAAAVLALGAAEAGLVLAGYDPLGERIDGRERFLRFSDAPDLVYELAPLVEGEAWGTDVRVNSAGFRGPEVDLDAGDRRRIVVLGDSIAFGNRMRSTEAFPARLQAMLDASAPAEFEVLNLAVGGYDVLQQVRNLELRGLPLDPDLVVVGYCLNDAGIASPNVEILRQAAALESSWLLRRRLAQLVTRSLGELLGGSENPNKPEAFRRIYAGRIDPIGDDESELLDLMSRVEDSYPAFWYGDRDKVGRLRHAFGRLRAAADEHGFDVVVVVIPWLEEDDDGRYPHDAVHGIVRHEAERLGFDVLDLKRRYMQRGIKSLRLVGSDHCHPTPLGHEYVAKALSRFVEKRWAGGSEEP